MNHVLGDIKCEETLKSGAVLVTVTVIGLLIQVTTISFSNPAKPCLVLCFDIEGHSTVTKPGTVNIKRRNPPSKSETKHMLFLNSIRSIESNHGTKNVNNGFSKLVKFWKNDLKDRRQKEIQFVRDVPKAILLWNSPVYFLRLSETVLLRTVSLRRIETCLIKVKLLFSFPDIFNFQKYQES